MLLFIGKINNLPRIDVNKINSVNTEFGCCGTKAYNTTESKCCSWITGNTIPNLSHIQCRDDGESGILLFAIRFVLIFS